MIKIIRLPYCYPVVFETSLRHWKPNGTNHGPKSNPWLIRFNPMKLGTSSSVVECWRLWVYFRGGYAWVADLYIDRRKLEKKVPDDV